jgi:hypothetical protein
VATRNLWDDRGRCKCGVSLVAGRPGQGRGFVVAAIPSAYSYRAYFVFAPNFRGTLIPRLRPNQYLLFEVPQRTMAGPTTVRG